MRTDSKKDGSASRTAEIEARIRDNYAQSQYHLVQFFTEQSIDALRTFGGDFDQVIVLAIIGQNHLNAFIAQAGNPDLVVNRASNATRIADITGLPRETVRRKLLKLAERGWVHQNAQREWELTGPPDDSNARRDLAEIDDRGIRRLARLYAGLEKIV